MGALNGHCVPTVESVTIGVAASLRLNVVLEHAVVVVNLSRICVNFASIVLNVVMDTTLLDPVRLKDVVDLFWSFHTSRSVTSVMFHTIAIPNQIASSVGILRTGNVFVFTLESVSVID